MLVIVSDLHLCDGTAYPQNVKAASFSLLQHDVYDLARRNCAKNLDIVFLGDVFDLLRTERWFEDDQGKPVPLEERPWGAPGALVGQAPPETVLARARSILDGILRNNDTVLAALCGKDAACPPPENCTVRRIYIPGNHDRLYNFDPRLRDTMRAALGAVDERALADEGIFPHHLAMPRYGLLARHGHEWDVMNFQSFRADAVPADYAASDYLATPIGDPITTELVARLPYDLCRRLAVDAAFRDTPELQFVRERMEQIEDVRPLAAALQWAFYETERLKGGLSPSQHDALRAAMHTTVRGMAKDFLALPFFRQWFESKHDAFHFDVARAFKSVLELLTVIDIGTVGHLSTLVSEMIDKGMSKGKDTANASREDLSGVAQAGLRSVVYGHTHEPRVSALRAGGTDDLYLNSGTWRRRQFLTADQGGFIGSEQFCYLAFYDEQERPDGARDGRNFECWMGSRRR